MIFEEFFGMFVVVGNENLKQCEFEIFVEPATRAALQINSLKITYQVNKLLNPDLIYEEYKNLN